MNQEKLDSLTEGLSRALAFVDDVDKMTRRELGYERTRHAAKRAVGQIEALLEALQEDWARDERELNEDIVSFQKDVFLEKWSKRSGSHR